MFPNLRRSQWLALTALLWPLASSANCDKVHYPLSTDQQYIVDAADCKQVLKSVNWFGGESAALVPGGLDKQPMALLINKIKSVGFNSVRLPWANEMVEKNPVVDKKLLTANPQLQGKKALEIFDIIIDALGDAGLMVILDNHRSRGDWCCDAEHGDGLWYSKDYAPSRFFDHWRFMAKRYKDKPFVVAAELRNEVRPDKQLNLSPSWGDGNINTDWKAAATEAANEIHSVNPNLLIMIGGLRWQTDLADIKQSPVTLNEPHKLVYVAHDYTWNHPAKNLTEPAAFAKTAYERWGFVMEPNQPYTAPLYFK